MTLVQFDYIEDYLEYIAGIRDLNGKVNSLWFGSNPVVALARYDVGFITSVANQTMSGLGLSDKQAHLATRLIRTYRRQLAKLGVGQPNLDHPQYRIPVRHLNYDRTVSLVDEKIHIRFPFNSAMITEIKDAIKESHGSVVWRKDDKVWELGLTEHNVNWAVAFGQAHQFTICEPLLELFNEIIECESTTYEIALHRSNGVYYITNAPESLNDYIQANVGFTNRNKLVDMSSVLGYKISDDLFVEMLGEYGSDFVALCQNTKSTRPPALAAGVSTVNTTMKGIIEWAIAVERFPIVVYNPLDIITEHSFDWAASYFTEEERTIVKNPSSNNVQVDSKVKIVYTNKPIHIPAKLLITYTSMMYGAEKLEWAQNFEKVVGYHNQMK